LEGQRRQALAGITVLDLTRARSGPTASRQLGDWGADVIKIEEVAAKHETPDGKGQRDFAPRFGPDFQNLHRNKRSLTLDLKSPAGLEVFKRLAAKADVLVENFRPDVKHRLGIDYETLSAINPRLIYASISGYGQDGPYRDWPGVDPIVQGMSGIMSITGEPGRGPMRAGIALVDTTSGIFAAQGILMALYERTHSGLGQWIQTSLLESAIFMLDFQGSRYLMKGEVAGQVGNNHPMSSPIGMYAARDGHIIVSPLPTMWAQFCRVIERDDLIDHPRYHSNALRCQHRDEVNAIVNEYCGRHDRADLIARFNANGIPSGPVYSIDQTFADEQVRHLGIAKTLPSARLGDVGMLGQPLSMSRTPCELVSAAPEAGEHNDAVLADFGFSADEIEALKRNDTI
jgi:crotonobetainyl-CoA:carnitine CoA-transferase CaiB-like acyl-CoA transferase